MKYIFCQTVAFSGVLLMSQTTLLCSNFGIFPSINPCFINWATATIHDNRHLKCYPLNFNKISKKNSNSSHPLRFPISKSVMQFMQCEMCNIIIYGMAKFAWSRPGATVIPRLNQGLKMRRVDGLMQPKAEKGTAFNLLR